MNARELYEIPEEATSDGGRGHTNPSFSHSLNDSFTSLPSIGRLTPVYSQGGSITSLNSSCVIQRPDGSTILVTPTREARSIPAKPPTEKRIKYMKGLSIVAIVLFPPTGVAAYIYALLTDREYKSAKPMGDFSSAKSKAKICERLLIASLICGIITYALIFGLIGRSVASSSDDTDVIRQG